MPGRSPFFVPLLILKYVLWASIAYCLFIAGSFYKRLEILCIAVISALLSVAGLIFLNV